MVSNDFLIDKKIREKIGTGRKLYNLIIGIILLIIGVINIQKHGFSIQEGRSFFNEAFVLMGIIVIIISITGREPFRTRYRLIMDNETIRIKKSFESELKINLNKITYLKITPLSIEITYNDYVKTYDFSWLTTQEFENLCAKLHEYCLINNISTE